MRSSTSAPMMATMPIVMMPVIVIVRRRSELDQRVRSGPNSGWVARNHRTRRRRSRSLKADLPCLWAGTRYSTVAPAR